MSTFSVTRAANGQILLSFKDLNNYNVGSVGTFTGDMTFSVGQTSGSSKETVIQIAQTDDDGSLVFEATNAKNSLEFSGHSIDASIKNQDSTPYNISWKANNSTFDSSKSGASVIFEGDKDSYNNYIKLGNAASKTLGKFDNLIFDNGKDNIYVSSEKSTNRVETSETSKGAVVATGNGENEFYIGGTLGAFIGGKGNDTFFTNKATANKNMMVGGDGADKLTDYAKNSLFIGGAGVDTANMYGNNGIANLGFNEKGIFDWTYGTGNSVFTGESQTDSTGKVYSYKETLAQHGWSRASYLNESNIINNPYYSLIKGKIEESLG